MLYCADEYGCVSDIGFCLVSGKDFTVFRHEWPDKEIRQFIGGNSAAFILSDNFAYIHWFILRNKTFKCKLIPMYTDTTLPFYNAFLETLSS